LINAKDSTENQGAVLEREKIELDTQCRQDVKAATETENNRMNVLLEEEKSPAT